MRFGKIPLCLSLLALTVSTSAHAQLYDTVSKFSLPVQLDSYVVKTGFDINAFIRRVRNDTTFYKAFKSMRFVPYDAVNDIQVFGKRDQVVASMHSKTRQHITRTCRSMTTLSQNTTGDFFKRDGTYRYYTAELFAYLFFTKDTVCNQSDVVAGSLNMKGEGQMAKSEYQLKQLIFNPGARISGIPFMSDRTSIFDREEAEKYDFHITRDVFAGEECFVFRITPKKGHEHKVIYDEFTTWFRKSDYSIIARNYSLSYSTLVYDFNVRMKVCTSQLNGKLFPTHVDYDGNWHVFTKKRERVRFSVDVTY